MQLLGERLSLGHHHQHAHQLTEMPYRQAKRFVFLDVLPQESALAGQRALVHLQDFTLALERIFLG